MANHADAAEQIDDPAQTVEDSAAGNAGNAARQKLSGTRLLVTVGLAIVAALAGLTGWLGYRSHQARQAQAQRNALVQTARQEAVNLSTISYAEADADIQRILDSTTGTFHDDFQRRSQPFVEVVKQVQSKSEGTIAEAALESETGDQAQVIVTVSVKTSTAAAPEQDPRRWRLRISVQRTADGDKVSNVGFVP